MIKFYLKVSCAMLVVAALACAGCVNQDKQGDLSEEEVAKMVEEFPGKDIRLIFSPADEGRSKRAITTKTVN